MMYDRPKYVQTLRWLGEPHEDGDRAWIERPVAGGEHDARGTWPYGSAPTEALLEALDRRATAAGGQRSLLTWTGVVRPDDCHGASLASVLEQRVAGRGLDVQVLKEHLAHVPDRPSARLRYSSRTRQRIRAAGATHGVAVEPIQGQSQALAAWQDAVRQARGIPRASSPERSHFLGLEAIGRAGVEEVCVVAARRREDGQLCGGLVMARSTDPVGWHAHSALCDSEARRDFVAYLLFDTAIDIFGNDPIWWGGQPAGLNGAGVWQFKERFANHSAPAHLVSIDLDPVGLAAVRKRASLSAWLPNYRDPTTEMAP